MNKLFEWLDQIETIIYAIAEFDAGDMSYDDFLLTRSPFIKILLKNWKLY